MNVYLNNTVSAIKFVFCTRVTFVHIFVFLYYITELISHFAISALQNSFVVSHRPFIPVVGLHRLFVVPFSRCFAFRCLLLSLFHLSVAS